MRVIQTVNDTIRLLFNPKTESFVLSDFLLVRDADENFLGQVVEIYDDKFDQESNVAKIRLVYRISNGRELTPYNNYTPSRECEVAKVKQSEIEKCINLNKPVINVGKSFKSGLDTKINLKFFENNCIVLADKYEQTNQITESLAPKLADKKNVLILDFSGSMAFDGITPFVAGANFKMPLSSSTIEYIKQKVLLRAKLETQAILGEIFEEVKNFLENSEEDYIPYNRFLRVVQAQYKQTPAVELLVLISWLKKYARMGIFAGHKREFENIAKSLDKNKITLIDLSAIKTEWQKEYLEYLINSIDKEMYLFVRLNDNNINNDILNLIYLKKKNITFIPSFSYGFKKASYIMDFAHNYILMPTLNPKRDFTHASFQIQSLNKDSFMLFGEDTKEFIFVIENSSIIKKRVEIEPVNSGKMLISLNLQLDEITPFDLKTENFEIRAAEQNKKKLQEEINLSDILSLKEEEEEKPESREEKEYVPVNDVNGVLDIEDNKEDLTEELSEDKEILPEINENETKIESEIEEKTELESENISDIDFEEETAPNEPEIEQNEEILPEDILGEDELDFFEQAEIAALELEENQTAEKEINLPEENFDKNADEKSDIAQNEKFNEKVEEKIEKLHVFDEKISKIDEKSEDFEEINTEKEKEETLPITEDEKKAELVKEKITDENVPLKTPATEDVAKETTAEEIAEAETAPNIISEEITPKEESTVIDAKEKAEIITEEVAPKEEEKKEKEEPVKESAADKKEISKPIKTRAPKEEPAETKEVKETKTEQTKTSKTAKRAKSAETADVTAKTTEEAAPEKPVQTSADEALEKEPKKEIKKKTKKAENEDVPEILAPANEEEKEALKGNTKQNDTPSSKDNEIDRKFDEILNETEDEIDDRNMFKVDDKISVDMNKIKKEINKPEHKLPIFNDDDDDSEETENDNADFEEGGKVFHEKYGEGTILKVLKYGERCLVQIDFNEVGKRLLDPKLAKFKAIKE